jgi:hypothetical protein
MKSSLSMSYSDFQRLLQLQKPKRQYEKISFTKAVHFPNGIKGYAPATYPEEYYTPRAKLNPEDYDIYHNSHIQEQLRLQYEKSEGKDTDILPWLDPKQAETVNKDPAESETLLGQDPKKGDVDVDTILGDARLHDQPLETKAGDGVVEKQNEAEAHAINDGQDGAQTLAGTDPRREENDGGYESAGANDPLDNDNLDALSTGNNSEQIDNNINAGVEVVDAQKDNENTSNDGQNALTESTNEDLPDMQNPEGVAESEEQGNVISATGETDANVLGTSEKVEKTSGAAEAEGGLEKDENPVDIHSLKIQE